MRKNENERRKKAKKGEGIRRKEKGRKREEKEVNGMRRKHLQSISLQNVSLLNVFLLNVSSENVSYPKSFLSQNVSLQKKEGCVCLC